MCRCVSDLHIVAQIVELLAQEKGCWHSRRELACMLASALLAACFQHITETQLILSPVALRDIRIT